MQAAFTSGSTANPNMSGSSRPLRRHRTHVQQRGVKLESVNQAKKRKNVKANVNANQMQGYAHSFVYVGNVRTPFNGQDPIVTLDLLAAIVYHGKDTTFCLRCVRSCFPCCDSCQPWLGCYLRCRYSSRRPRSTRSSVRNGRIQGLEGCNQSPSPSQYDTGRLSHYSTYATSSEAILVNITVTGLCLRCRTSRSSSNDSRQISSSC